MKSFVRSFTICDSILWPTGSLAEDLPFPQESPRLYVPLVPPCIHIFQQCFSRYRTCIKFLNVRILNSSLILCGGIPCNT